MKIEGTTDTIPLRELIEMISYSSVTGALNLYSDKHIAGHLYFRDGNLYHADFEGYSGVEALAQLFELSYASFSFVSDITSDEESLWGDMDYHVRIAERLAQRWQNIRAHIPSVSLIPVLIVPCEAAMRRLGPAYHQILDRINGQHTIHEIVSDLGWATIEVAEVIAQMRQDKLIDLRDAAVQTATPAAGPTRTSLLDRLRSRGGDPPRPPGAEAQRISPEELILQVLRS